MFWAEAKVEGGLPVRDQRTRGPHGRAAGTGGAGGDGLWVGLEVWRATWTTWGGQVAPAAGASGGDGGGGERGMRRLVGGCLWDGSGPRSLVLTPGPPLWLTGLPRLCLLLSLFLSPVLAAANSGKAALALDHLCLNLFASLAPESLG